MNNRTLAILILGGIGAYVLLNRQPAYPPPPVQPPTSQHPSDPKYLKWVKWAGVIVALFGKAKELWEPGGIFYKTPVPQYDAGSQFWQDVSDYA